MLNFPIAVNENPRSESPKSESSESGSEASDEEARYNYFTGFLKSHLKKQNNQGRKARRSVGKYLSRRLPQFSPISSTLSKNPVHLKNTKTPVRLGLKAKIQSDLSKMSTNISSKTFWNKSLVSSPKSVSARGNFEFLRQGHEVVNKRNSRLKTANETFKTPENPVSEKRLLGM